MPERPSGSKPPAGRPSANPNFHLLLPFLSLLSRQRRRASKRQRRETTAGAEGEQWRRRALLVGGACGRGQCAAPSSIARRCPKHPPVARGICPRSTAVMASFGTATTTSATAGAQGKGRACAVGREATQDQVPGVRSPSGWRPWQHGSCCRPRWPSGKPTAPLL